MIDKHTPSSRYRRSFRALFRICSILNSMRGAIGTAQRGWRELAKEVYEGASDLN